MDSDDVTVEFTSERHVFISALCRFPPVSTNKLYSGAGKRYLSKKGQAYKDEVISLLSGEISLSGWPDYGWKDFHEAFHAHGGSAHLEITLFMADFYNPKWKQGELVELKNGYRSPYKVKDTTNYVKLLEDAVSRATGIDDSCTVSNKNDKKPTEGESYAVIEANYYLWDP